jgi:hypothetical protein
MGLFSDSAGPWYQSITAPLFIWVFLLRGVFSFFERRAARTS